MHQQNHPTLIIFPSLLFSGHEKMATKHFLTGREKKISLTSVYRIDFKNFVIFLVKLILLRRTFTKVLLVNGSPFGHVILKMFLKLFKFYIIEYTPFPELPEMKDKFFHSLVAWLNEYLVDVRILIDDWQVNFSKAPVNYVIKNYV